MKVGGKERERLVVFLFFPWVINWPGRKGREEGRKILVKVVSTFLLLPPPPSHVLSSLKGLWKGEWWTLPRRLWQKLTFSVGITISEMGFATTEKEGWEKERKGEKDLKNGSGSNFFFLASSSRM